MKTRVVEVYVGLTYGGDSGDWYVVPTGVPADLPQDEAEKLAIEQVEEAMDDDVWVAFMGVYHYYTDDEMITYEDELSIEDLEDKEE